MRCEFCSQKIDTCEEKILDADTGNPLCSECVGYLTCAMCDTITTASIGTDANMVHTICYKCLKTFGLNDTVDDDLYLPAYNARQLDVLLIKRQGKKIIGIKDFTFPPLFLTWKKFKTRLYEKGLKYELPQVHKVRVFIKDASFIFARNCRIDWMPFVDERYGSVFFHAIIPFEQSNEKNGSGAEYKALMDGLGFNREENIEWVLNAIWEINGLPGSPIC